MEKLTDNEIIKALECCSSQAGCDKCGYFTGKAGCMVFMATDALDLINRQRAEIERLQKKKKAKCGTCEYAIPTTFGKSKLYVECTNQEHIQKFCKRKISLKRQRTNPACKCYKEKAETQKINHNSLCETETYKVDK